MNAEVEQIFINLQEYFERFADADYKEGQYVTNEEMRRLSDVIRLKELYLKKLAFNESKKTN